MIGTILAAWFALSAGAVFGYMTTAFANIYPVTRFLWFMALPSIAVFALAFSWPVWAFFAVGGGFFVGVFLFAMMNVAAEADSHLGGYGDGE